jgi:CheY-like chemotaxis protein
MNEPATRCDDIQETPSLSDDAGFSGKERGCETILLVDDDQGVRRISTLILQDAGYTVLAACDGVEAIDLFSRPGCKVDGVILDIVMPRMNGIEAYERIKAIDAQIPIMFVSAWLDPSFFASEFVKGICFVRKPYTRRILLEALRNCLDSVSR